MSRISDLAGFTTAISTTEDLSVGIITASSFSGNLTGDVTGTATGLAAGATGSDLTLSGNLSIGGTLTYQDVTNVDAVGMVTARKGLQVLADGLDVTGVGTFKSNVSIADKIIHTGDTDTAIRFPAADTFTVETAGSERVRVTSDGKVGINSASPHQALDIGGTTVALVKFTPSNYGSGASDGAQIGVNFGGLDVWQFENNYLRLGTNNTERLRIDSTGRIGINTNSFNDAAETLRVQAPSGQNNTHLTIKANSTSGFSILNFGDDDFNEGRIIYDHSDNSMQFRTDDAERLRVTSTGGVHFNNAELIERVNITSGKLSDNQDINLDDGMAHLFTTTETTTATPNIRITTGINTHMAVGDVISVNIITTAAAAGYAATVHIDGVTVGTNGGSLVWNGGDAPTEGGASGNDFYSYSIIKTASATYTVLANVANFA